jgi:uncharacterized protein YraI
MWRKFRYILVLLAAVSIAALAASRVSGQTSSLWDARYYDNPYFLNEPVRFQKDGAIAFDWGNGSPGSDLPSDYFSVRWGTDRYFPAGTYRFYVWADDGVCLWVDFQRVCDHLEQPQPGQRITSDVTLNEGMHHIQVDYRENWGDAFVFLDWANLATSPAGPSFSRRYQYVPGYAPYFSSEYWSTQYYPSTALSGYPTVIQAEGWPLVHYWGEGSPVAGIGSDHFSARWNSSRYVTGGQYRITARADDGVRLWVDGQLVINEFHGATGITYTADLFLSTGQHNFMVDFYEAAGTAFIDVQLTPITNYQTYSPTVVTGAGLRVTADVLNVRQSPNCNCGIVTKITRGETYPIIGRNADSSWWQVSVRNAVGWVYGKFVETFGTAYIPVTDMSVTEHPSPTGYRFTAGKAAIIRSGPGNRFAYLGRVPAQHTAEIVGRNTNQTWWQIEYEGTVGWINAAYGSTSPGGDTSRIPVRV